MVAFGMSLSVENVAEDISFSKGVFLQNLSFIVRQNFDQRKSVQNSTSFLLYIYFFSCCRGWLEKISRERKTIY